MLDPRTKEFGFIKDKRIRDEIIEKVKNIVTYINSRNIANFQSSKTPSVRTAAEQILMGDIFLINKANKNTPLEEELEIYSALPTQEIKNQAELLVWWKTYTTKLPQLAHVARIVMGIPASSAPSERVFSVTNLIGSANRSRITAENFSFSSFVSLNKHNVQF